MMHLATRARSLQVLALVGPTQMHAKHGTTCRRRARTHGHIAAASTEELHAELLEVLQNRRLQTQIARDQSRALAPLLKVPRLIVHGRGAIRATRVAAAIVVSVHRPRKRAVHLLTLLAGEHRRGKLRGRELAWRPEVILERVWPAAALEEGRFARVAHSGILARWERSPLDVRPAGVQLAELDLVQREHQRGHEPVRFVVIWYSQGPPIAAHAASGSVGQLVARAALELSKTLVRSCRLSRALCIAGWALLAHGRRGLPVHAVTLGCDACSVAREQFAVK